MSLVLVTRRLLWSFGGVIVPWFFMFLEVLWCCLHIWSSSYLLQSLLIDFGREIPSVSPARHSEVSGYAYSTFLVASCGRILKLICLLSILQCTRPEADRLPFAFPRIELKLEFVVSPWPADLGHLSTHAHYCLPELALTAIRSAFREISHREVCRWGTWSIGSACGPFGRFQR